ncbi:MAG: type II toxin-antitoxin system RelE/ParE family toxin [Candidatus Aenigmarchaeota archaeon]|nr:type II toxin-antitoxin system RelE/ParE family toxin [Candidatus Aenigmarchaeota archaeon]
MAYSVIWSPRSKEDLIELETGLARRIIKKTTELELAPYHFIEKMTDVNCWKLRVGDYRVLLDIKEERKEIQVLKVGHRKNIYKQL